LSKKPLLFLCREEYEKGKGLRWEVNKRREAKKRLGWPEVVKSDAGKLLGGH